MVSQEPLGQVIFKMSYEFSMFTSITSNSMKIQINRCVYHMKYRSLKRKTFKGSYFSPMNNTRRIRIKSRLWKRRAIPVLSSDFAIYLPNDSVGELVKPVICFCPLTTPRFLHQLHVLPTYRSSDSLNGDFCVGMSQRSVQTVFSGSWDHRVRMSRRHSKDWDKKLC